MEKKFLDLTLLYIDDDHITRVQAILYLKKMFKKVWSANDGLQALKIYNDYKPDIIISDIKMPNLDGLAMSKIIREKDLKTPIILVTAYTDTNYLLKAVELNLIKYIIKPISSYKLQEALNIAYKHIHNNIEPVLKLSENILYDTLNKSLLINNNIIKLTKKESQLLYLLIKYRTRIVTYEEIENYIWIDKYMSIDTLRSLVKSLRKKIDIIKIENISGFGYKIVI